MKAWRPNFQDQSVEVEVQARRLVECSKMQMESTLQPHQHQEPMDFGCSDGLAYKVDDMGPVGCNTWRNFMVIFQVQLRSGTGRVRSRCGQWQKQVQVLPEGWPDRQVSKPWHWSGEKYKGYG